MLSTNGYGIITCFFNVKLTSIYINLPKICVCMLLNYFMVITTFDSIDFISIVLFLLLASNCRLGLHLITA
jgi:hypothetical protein